MAAMTTHALAEILGTGPLAIDPTALAHLTALTAPDALDAARRNQPQASAGGTRPSTVGVDVVDGTAVVTIGGVLVARRTWLSDLFGATALPDAHRAVQDAFGDPAVRGVLLVIDSPGGAVQGVSEIAATIRAGRESKPVAAWTSGTLASAAFWIASAADVIAISNPTTPMVGSIGVAMSHVDVSGAERMAGIQTTEIVAGKYKRIDSKYAPLSADGRATLQDMVDRVYAGFVADVAAGRRMAAVDVLDRIADGRVFVGRQALEVGAVDVVASFDQVLGDLQRTQEPHA
jgi:signal peptide peptidase SppA